VFIGSLYLCEGLKYLIFMFLFSYFIKQSVSLLTENVLQKWTILIRYMLIASSILYVCYGIEYLTSKILKADSS
jgi:hypothetical protein